jgi:hypothetical protein
LSVGNPTTSSITPPATELEGVDEIMIWRIRNDDGSEMYPIRMNQRQYAALKKAGVAG